MQRSLADRKRIFPGEDQVERFAVCADPFGWEGAAFAGSDVPGFIVIDGGPWAPRLRRIEDCQAAFEAAIGWGFAGDALAPEIAFERAVVADVAAIAFAFVGEDRGAFVDVAGPEDKTFPDLLEKFV